LDRAVDVGRSRTGAVRGFKNSKGWTLLMVADGVEYTSNVLKRYPDAAAYLRQVFAERGLPVPPPLESPPTLRRAAQPEQ
jgi:hypothetical protein